MTPEAKLKALRAIDKLDRLGPSAVMELLTVGRKDKSGDFTEGAALSLPAARFIMKSIGVDVEVICYRPELQSAIIYIE